MSDNAPPSIPTGITENADSLGSFVLLGKMAFFLCVLIALILFCAWLVKRLTQPTSGKARVRVIGSTLLGPRERVVVIEVQDTWLVLGVTSGQINKLHELPAQVIPETPNQAELPLEHAGFATRFAAALRHNLQNRSNGS